MGLNIKANNVIPHLDAETLKQVLAQAEAAGLELLSDAEIKTVRSEASKHNSMTGFSMNPVLALACGLELKGRSQTRQASEAGAIAVDAISA